MPNFDNLTIGNNYNLYLDMLKDIPEFSTLKGYLVNMQEKLDAYSKPDSKQGNTIPVLDEDAKEQILSEYAKISSEISRIKNEHKQNNTALPEDDLKVLNSIESSIAGDTHSINNYDPSKGYTNLPFIFENSKAIKVDVSDKSLGSVGAAQSSRVPFKYNAPDGRQYDGFFTQSKIFDPYKEILKKSEQYSDRKDWQRVFNGIVQFSIVYTQKLISQKYKFSEPPLSEMSKDVQEKIMRNEKVSDDELIPSTLAVLLCRGVERTKKDTITITSTRIDEIINAMGLQEDTEDLADFLDEHKNDPIFEDMARFFANTKNTIGLHFVTGIGIGNRIDSRNAAMSSVAALLGKPDLIAKAIPMTIVRDGIEIKGCFMSTAKGIDPNARTEEDWKIGSNAVDKSPALASMADLQVLDFICGNTDRHGGNFVYQYDKNNHVMKSIIGIDNDLSFGTYVPKDDNARIQSMTALNAMKVMTESMASKIENLSKDQLMQTLAPYELTQKEMNACWERTQMVKRKIIEGREAYKNFGEKPGLLDGQIRIIPDKDFSNLTVRSLSARQHGKSFNIFARSKVLDAPLEATKNLERTDVTKSQYKFDANAVKEYAEDGFWAVDRMDRATNYRGSSTEFENLKTALESYGMFHKNHRGQMMNDGDILQHDKMLANIDHLCDVYLQHHENKKSKSDYANDRAQLVRDIREEFQTKYIFKNLTTEDKNLIHEQDEKNLNAMNSQLRAEAQKDIIKSVIYDDIRKLKSFADAKEGNEAKFEDALKMQLYHAQIADMYCNEKMQIKQSDFLKVQDLLNKSDAGISEIENLDFFKDISQQIKNPEVRQKYVKKLDSEFKFENNTMTRNKAQNEVKLELKSLQPMSK